VTSAPSKTTTVKTVNNTGNVPVTTSKSTTVSGGSTTVTTTKTIGTPKMVSSGSSSVSTPSKLPGAVLGERWIADCNDAGWVMCGPVAVANTLLASTGMRAANAAIEALYARSGGIGDTGVPVPAVLAAAQIHGLAGCRLKSYRRAGLDDADLVLLEFGRLPGVHAAAFAGLQVITWGTEVPLAELDARILGAWQLAWHGTEVPCG
jgi:hypothetical protein